MARNRWLKPHGSGKWWVLIALLLTLPHLARASDYRWGLTTGYGGEGISATVPNITSTGQAAGGTTTAVKAEGPLIAGVFIERLLSDTFLVGFEHVRGISVNPFSGGTSFTGFSFRWYFFGPAPAYEKPAPGESSLFIKRWAPFLGLSTGLALADIYRDDDKQVPHISGSGAYFGVRAGFDYLMSPNYGIRPELTTASTTYLDSFSNASTPPALDAFALQCSWFFNF